MLCSSILKIDVLRLCHGGSKKKNSQPEGLPPIPVPPCFQLILKLMPNNDDTLLNKSPFRTDSHSATSTSVVVGFRYDFFLLDLLAFK